MLESKLSCLACIFLLSVSFTLVDYSSAQISGRKCPSLLNEIRKANSENIQCGKVIHEEECPPDTIYMQNAALCGWCPACVRYLGPNDDNEPCVPRGSDETTWSLDSEYCDLENPNHCPIVTNECLPGLFCNEANGNKCECPGDACKLANIVPPSKPLLVECLEDDASCQKAEMVSFSTVDVDRSECLYRKSLYRLTIESSEGVVFDPLRLHHWDPTCDPDGSFAPKQCKGTHYSGECFCVNRVGKRIFGREWRVQAENQTCACSRRVSELRSQGFIGSYHCTPDGNFEPLQCDSDTGLCYCVEEKTGKVLGPVVPQAQWNQLPCYSLNVTGGNRDGKYLRICESIYAATRALQIENNYHGATIELPRLNCDYDGSYSPIRKRDLTSECVFKNGTRILNFLKQNAPPEMLCNCARDTYEYFPKHLHPRRFNCKMDNDVGNYDVAQDFGSYSACIDADGFLYGEIVNSRLMCCLLGEGCSTNSQAKCFKDITEEEDEDGDGDDDDDDDSNLNGIKSCSWWQFKN